MQVMRTLIACLLFTAASVFAHPSVSVVIDSRGNVYYSDLIQIWRVVPNGTRTIAVPHVHSHELYLDAAGTLYGENLWYNGETLKTWGNAVWKRTVDGRVSFVHPPRAGFNEDFSFVRDAAGNQSSSTANGMRSAAGRPKDARSRSRMRRSKTSAG